MIHRFASGGDATQAQIQKDDSWRLHRRCDAEMATVRRRRTRKERMLELLFMPQREHIVSCNEQYKRC
jgi:hypothetical protein